MIPVKILYVLPAVTICGGIRIAFEHCNRLSHLGHFVSIYCTNGAMAQDWFPALNVGFLKAGDIKDKNFDKIIGTFWTTIYDIEKLNIQGEKYYLVQGKEPYFYNNKDTFDKVNKTFLFKNYKYICISKSTKLWLEEQKDIQAFYVPNAINHNQFFVEKFKDKTSNKVIVLIEGDSEFYYKNIYQGLLALQPLREKIEIWYLSSNPKYIDKIMYDKLYASPAQKDLHKIYSTCDIFLKPTLLEGSPLPILEAMACGCAIVSTDIPSVREFCVDNINSLLCRKANINDYAKAVELLVDYPEHRKFLSKNALYTAKKFDWDKSIEMLKNALKLK